MAFFRTTLSTAVACALAAATIAAPVAFAAPDGSNVVINEVYGGGGNNGSVFANDFVELYNPTNAPIDITGWTIDQRSIRDTSGGNAAVLTGVIPARGYFLIQGAAGNNATAALPVADQEAQFGFSGTEAIAVLFDATQKEVDLVGWGGAVRFEGAPGKKTGNATSIQRAVVGKDSDNNAADFVVGAPTPMNSAAPGTEDPGPEDPDPEDPGTGTPGTVTPIAEIQGTGAVSPFDGQTVTTEGVVTAVYNEGGKNGFFLQTAGSGTATKNVGDASDAIFVYMDQRTDYPLVGASVQVAGNVKEFYEQTQITASTIKPVEEALAAPVAIQIDNLPAGDDAREPYEGMLVRPVGDYTVTNNYTLNSLGEIGLAPGTVAHRTPTDVALPGAEANALQAKQDAELVYLDDGRTRDYFRTDKSTPLPYLLTADKGITSIRTGDQVDFQNDVVVDFSFDQWRFQPLQPITGKSVAADLPITWEDSREATLAVPDSVAGDYSVAAFNVLNYFTTLGESVPNCRAFNDMYGQPVAANNCAVRGAYSAGAFEDQQAKIVNAINRLDVSVLGLAEIENTYPVTGDINRRDEALSKLVTALNAAGGNWGYVASPDQVGTNEDVIRVAFIYNKAEVEPIGASRIFDDPAYTGTARQPLAQEFAPVGANGENSFVAVVNHFKSKGSVAQGDGDSGDGQGNNPNVRLAQSTALIDHLEKQDDWADKPVFIVGDLNSYAKEDAFRHLEQSGFTNIASMRDFDGASYQFGGQLGSLDHVLANEAASALIEDAAVWNINADESIAFEYSRRNYNIQDFFQADNPFRSSDHDPVKVGFSFSDSTTPVDPTDPAPGSSISSRSPASSNFVANISSRLGLR